MTQNFTTHSRPLWDLKKIRARIKEILRKLVVGKISKTRVGMVQMLPVKRLLLPATTFPIKIITPWIQISYSNARTMMISVSPTITNLNRN